MNKNGPILHTFGKVNDYLVFQAKSIICSGFYLYNEYLNCNNMF